MNGQQQCQEQVRDKGSSWPRFHQCKHKAVSWHDGKHYCKLHHPDTVKAKQDKADAEYKAQLDRKRYEYRAVQYCLKKKLTIKDLDKALGGEF